MVYAAAVAVAVLAFVSLAEGEGEPVTVVSITPGKFDEYVEENKQMLVEFYAPWCGHCKKLAPEYEKASVQLRESHGIVLAKLDATEDKETATRFNVKGFPTMLWFDHGKDTEFDGGRTTEAIVEWCVSMIGEPVTEVVEAPAPTGLKPFVVLYAPTKLGEYDAAAKENRRKATWYFVKTSTNPKVDILHAGEKPVEMLEGLHNKTLIEKFLEDNNMPLFGSLDSDTWDKYQETGSGLIWTLFKKPESKTIVEEYGAMMSEVATTVKGKYYVTYTDIEKNMEQIDAMLSIKESELPAIVLQKRAGDKVKYVLFEPDMTVAAINKFILEVEEGSIAPRLRTEPVPTKNDGEVKIVVSTTMREEIYVDNKDVVFFVYAPWCGHCKKLEPEFSKLAKKIKVEGMDDLVKLAKLDGTANDSPIEEVDWTGFPTLYLVKAGSNNATVYDGERTAKGLWKYVRKNGALAEQIKQRMETLKDAKKRAGEL